MQTSVARSRLPGAWVRLLAALAVAAGVAWLAAGQWDELSPLLAKADPRWIAGGTLALFANYWFRALRFRLLTGSRLKLWPEGMLVSGTHGVLTYLLPLRVGELALPPLLQSLAGIGLGEGFHILIWSRVLDISALGACILAAWALLPGQVSGAAKALWALAGAGLALLPFCLAAFSRLHAARPRWLFRHVHHLAHLGKMDRRGFGLSVAIWITIGLLIYCTARALGLALGPADAWFLSTVQMPFQILPIQGVASSGSHEAGWVGAMALLGYDPKEALRFALAGHLLILVYVAVFTAFLGVLALWVRARGRGGKDAP